MADTDAYVEGHWMWVEGRTGPVMVDDLYLDHILSAGLNHCLAKDSAGAWTAPPEWVELADTYAPGTFPAPPVTGPTKGGTDG